MPALIYLLCAITSLMCTGLLARRYRQSKTELLLWSSLAFAALAVSNILLFIDLIVVPQIDLSVWRNAITLSGVLLLLYGLTNTGSRA